MTNVTESLAKPSSRVNWSQLLASIPDADLDLLISVGEKMQRREAVLTPDELEVCLRWHPQIDLFSVKN